MLFKQSKEEIANTFTHFSGMIFSLIFGILLIGKSIGSSWVSLLAALVFSVSVFLMYSASAIYHWVLPGKLKMNLRYLDHINIYFLIAASYTPILLCAIGGGLGWSVFVFLWVVALAGCVYKFFFLGKFPRLSLSIYLLMGWSVLFIAKPVWQNLSESVLLLILSEGLFYTIGTYFYSKDRVYPYYHAIWHLFVLLGTLMHCIAVWLII
ncbi:MAG: PAQR family membrane homeostasis protein TrhA [Bacteroidales bacterium]